MIMYLFNAVNLSWKASRWNIEILISSKVIWLLIFWLHIITYVGIFVCALIIQISGLCCFAFLFYWLLQNCLSSNNNIRSISRFGKLLVSIVSHSCPIVKNVLCCILINTVNLNQAFSLALQHFLLTISNNHRGHQDFITGQSKMWLIYYKAMLSLEIMFTVTGILCWMYLYCKLHCKYHNI